MSEELMKCPEGVELDLICYLTSDKTGLNVKISVKGLPAITSFKTVADAASLATAQGLTKFADDWRMMTRAEIKTYKEEEDQEDDD